MILHRSLRWILIYGLLLGGMVFLFLRLPTSFLPLEDRGMFTTSVQLPSGSTQQQTLKVVEEVEKYYFTHEKDNIMSVFPRSVQALAGTVKTWRVCLSV